MTHINNERTKKAKQRKPLNFTNLSVHQSYLTLYCFTRTSVSISEDRGKWEFEKLLLNSLDDD